MQLTKCQELATEALNQFLMSDKKYFVLLGAAGVGKTTLLNHVEKNFQYVKKMLQITGNDIDNFTWVYTATTNKAVNSIRLATGHQAETIHSLLGLRLVADYQTGNFKLIPPNGINRDIDKLVIVVDEASYIDYDLLNYIDNLTPRCKVIFMGDKAQGTPVGLNHSPVFMQGHDTFTMTEVIRQRADNPLVQALNSFRDYILGITSTFPKIKLSNAIVWLDKQAFNTALETEFTANTWHSSKSKIICRYNRTVNKYNKQIFTLANQRSEYDFGDIVLSNHAVDKIKTDQEVEIAQVFKNQEQHGIKGTEYRVDTGYTKLYVFMPNKVSHIRKRCEEAITNQETNVVKDIMSSWVDLRPTYSCTVNKSQGSTFDKVYVDLNDFKGMKDKVALARSLYVAFSRAKEQIILTGDIA